MIRRLRKIATALGVAVVTGVMAITLWAGQNKTQWDKATFQVTGLHCSACVDAVRQALIKSPGVKTARVMMKDKIAVVKYAATKTFVQTLSKSIEATPSPMPNSVFQSALILQVNKVKSDGDAESVQNALSKVKGVNKAEVDTENGKTLITFDKDGDVKLSRLIDAVSAAGFEATAWTPQNAKESKNHEGDDHQDNNDDSRSHSGHGGHHGGGGC